MSVLSLTAVLATILGWCLLAGRLQRWGLTSPIIFVTAGFLFAEGFKILNLTLEPHLVKVIAEVTLVWVLFADASLVTPAQFRRDLGMYGRLLGIGLPLTVALGTVVAMMVLGLDPWPALLIGAALAPTDAALGATVMSDPKVPSRIRRILNVESGLNDGIATPVVLVAIAGIAVSEGIDGIETPSRAVVSLLVGLLVGVLVGGLGGFLTQTSRARGWLSEQLAGPEVLALALLAYTVALLVDGNGFVSAFAGGLAFGAVAGRGGEKEVFFVEQSAALSSMISWLVFGALVVPMIGEFWSWRILAYAVLSLTAVRMVPVALALTGAGLDRYSVAFVGWFGPRGLASVIFALIALEDLHSVAEELVAVIALTVLLSVVTHGLTAKPLANRYKEGDDDGDVRREGSATDHR